MTLIKSFARRTHIHACTPTYVYRDIHTFMHTCINSYIKTSPLLSHPGESIPLRPRCISPLFQISPLIFPKIFRLENFQNFTFSRNFFPFSSAKISDDLFLVIDHKFSLFQYIFPPLFRKIITSPYFEKFPPYFSKIHLLFTYFMSISFPPTLTMMHLCITQCTYWTPLITSTTDKRENDIHSFIHSIRIFL